MKIKEKLKLPQKIFRPQFEVCTQTNIFQKKKICLQILVFCLHNVVHDALKLEFFPFLFNFF